MIQIINDVCTLSGKNFSWHLKVINGRLFRYDNVNKESEVHGQEDVHVSAPELLSSYGHLDYREPLLLIADSKGFYTNRFVVNDWKVSSDFVEKNGFPQVKEKKQYLVISYQNEQETIRVYQYFYVFEETDTLMSFVKVVNNGFNDIHIKRALSMQLDLLANDYSIMTFTGKWAHERNITINKANKGVFKNASIAGCSSSYNNPAFILFKENEYYLFNLLYSNNHMELVEEDHNSTTRALIGVNDIMEDIVLKSNQEYITPEAILTIGNSLNDVKVKSNAFIRKNILPDNSKFPVVFNVWESFGFGVTKDNYIELAKIAKSIGSEVFVFDDGWFGKRNSDTSSLGDWYLNEDKLGSWNEINSNLQKAGLKLGIWIEPEMANPDSKLLEEHPHFAMRLPNVKPVLGRNQLVLDMANPVVVDTIFDILCKTIDEAKPAYIKWDYNRTASEVFSTVANGGNLFQEFQKGTYHLKQKLLEKYPDIIFEGCASGGARFDLGILSYFPVIWTSDDTDCKQRMIIQEGTNIVYPMNTISTHVSDSPNEYTKKVSSIEDRINVALFGRYGYECNLLKLPQNELDALKAGNDYHKKYEDLILNGDSYLNLNNPKHVKGFTIVNTEKTEAIALVVFMEKIESIVKFEGLDDNKKYALSFRKQSNVIDEDIVANGIDLREKGISIKTLFKEKDAPDEFYITSRVINLKEN